MGAMASRITGNFIDCLAGGSVKQVRKHKYPYHWPFARGIHYKISDVESVSISRLQMDFDY